MYVERVFTFRHKSQPISASNSSEKQIASFIKITAVNTLLMWPFKTSISHRLTQYLKYFCVKTIQIVTTGTARNMPAMRSRKNVKSEDSRYFYLPFSARACVAKVALKPSDWQIIKHCYYSNKIQAGFYTSRSFGGFLRSWAITQFYFGC